MTAAPLAAWWASWPPVLARELLASFGKRDQGALLIGAGAAGSEVTRSAALAPQLAPCDPMKVDTRVRMQGPSAAHPFGTDQLGRDVLSRVIHGGRPSLEWGAMLTGARDYFATAWWLSLFPGAAIVLVVLCMNTLGDAARDVMSPWLQEVKG